MTDRMSTYYEMLQRQSLRKTIHKIRGMLREGNLAGLEPVEQKLAQIVMDHPEYQEQFEDKGLLDGRDIPSDGVNPFLHISMHQMIEDQLAAESPIEAILLCEYLEMAGNSRHEAVHAVMMVLSHTIYHSYKNKQPFNAERYKRLLSKCRKVKPSEIRSILERESTGS